MKKYTLLVVSILAYLCMGFVPEPGKFVKITNDNTTLIDPTQAQLLSALGIAATPPITLGFTTSNGGIQLTTGKRKGYATCSVAGTISKWSIAIDTGTATVKVWKIATGTAVPTISNLINTTGLQISSGTYVLSSTVSDFSSTAVAAGDVFAFDVSAVSAVTQMTFTLYVAP